MKACILGLLALVALTKAQQVDYDCNQNSGYTAGVAYRITHPSSCLKFYSCNTAGDGVEMDCAPGTFFNQSLQTCAEGDCNQFRSRCTPSQTRWIFADTCCNRYYNYNCVQTDIPRFYTLETCPTGQFFDQSRDGQAFSGSVQPCTTLQQTGCRVDCQPSEVFNSCEVNNQFPVTVEGTNTIDQCRFRKRNGNGVLQTAERCARGTRFNATSCMCVLDINPELCGSPACNNGNNLYSLNVANGEFGDQSATSEKYSVSGLTVSNNGVSAQYDQTSGSGFIPFFTSNSYHSDLTLRVRFSVNNLQQNSGKIYILSGPGANGLDNCAGNANSYSMNVAVQRLGNGYTVSLEFISALNAGGNVVFSATLNNVNNNNPSFDLSFTSAPNWILGSRVSNGDVTQSGTNNKVTFQASAGLPNGIEQTTCGTRALRVGPFSGLLQEFSLLKC